MVKYNIYIICNNEEVFLEKVKEINLKYKSKICHIQWVPAEYLKLTQCNKKMLKDLNTRYNTQQKKILAKLGTIGAHRKALLAIYMNKTNNNIILEQDANFSDKPRKAMVLRYMPSTSLFDRTIPDRVSANGGKYDFSNRPIYLVSGKQGKNDLRN